MVQNLIRKQETFEDDYERVHKREVPAKSVDKAEKFEF